MGESRRSTRNGRREHSEEYLAAQRKRREGVSEGELREAVATVGEDEVRELVRNPHRTLMRIVKAAEGTDPEGVLRGEYGGDDVERTQRHDELRERREALVVLAASEFGELRAMVGLASAGGLRRAAKGQQRKRGEEREGSSEAYWMARALRTEGVSEREVTAAIAELGEAHVRSLLGREQGTFGRLVRHAEQAESGARERAYRILAATEWNLVRRIVGLPVDVERERRSCAAWARKMSEGEGVSAGRLRGAVNRVEAEQVAILVDGAEPFFSGAVRRAARAMDRSVKRSWVRIAASDPERVRATVREAERSARRERSELYASSPKDAAAGNREVRVVQGRSRREVALSAVGPMLLGALRL
jgi:hypothetical protein